MSWMVPSDKSSNENISDGQKSCLDKNGGPGPGPQPIAKKDNSVFELDDDLLSELDAVLNDNTNGPRKGYCHKYTVRTRENQNMSKIYTKCLKNFPQNWRELDLFPHQ